MGEGPEGKRVCPECGSPSLVMDYTRAQLACRKCGYVLEVGILDRGPEWRSFEDDEQDRSRVGPPTTPTIHDKGLSTRIGRGYRDARGNSIAPERRAQLYRMRTQDWRSRLAGRNRYLARALSDLTRVCSQMVLPATVRERAAFLYRRASELDLIRGRPMEAVISAALYTACLESDVPVQLDEIADIAGVDVERAVRARRLLVRELELGTPRVSPLQYVRRIVEKLQIERSVGERALRIIADLGGDLPSTHSSRSLAAGAVYLAAQRTEFPLAQTDVGKATGLSRAAVQAAARAISRRRRVLK